MIRTLRGFYVKLGQIGATRSDFVARQYIERRARASPHFSTAATQRPPRRARLSRPRSALRRARCGVAWRRMETLQDNCPYEPLEYVRGVVERALERPFDEARPNVRLRSTLFDS